MNIDDGGLTVIDAKAVAKLFEDGIRYQREVAAETGRQLAAALELIQENAEACGRAMGACLVALHEANKRDDR
jgi:hypothetical protein